MAMQKWILKKIKKPCPFCGRMDRLEITQADSFRRMEKKAPDGMACISMTCKNCYVDMYEHTHDIHDYKQRVQMLMDKWNGRAGE